MTDQQFLVGDLKIKGNLVLAPMDGYTDWPFRSLCRELGSAISYTEFVKAEDVLQRPHYIQNKIHFTEKERPVFIQVYGNQADALLEAALQLQETGPDGIDINMGCPNRSIAGRGAGAGLMRTPLKVVRIMKTLSRSLDLPITAKIRLGWQDCQNGMLLSQIIEEYGGSLVAVHARSKEQGHEGQPDLSALAEIKQALAIPVLGNGGVRRVSDIDAMIETTGCDGVMIGRGAVANPWIFSRRDREEIGPAEVQELLLEHLERSLSFYGPENGLVLFRKFAAGYLSPYDLDPNRRKKILTETDPAKFKLQVRGFFEEIGQGD
ncbi:MAG: tRNA dihydrouridine synthase DusB [Chloroflexi bacterium]|nr:MAG: tRNA dihydrouridine synthase DusB [Chloroflexota bacterium]